MGYTLKIGEAAVEADLSERWATCTVADARSDDAPLGSTPAAEHSNECCPSYTAWHEFTRRTKLVSVFFPVDRHAVYDGLLSSHPGCAKLTQDHLLAFKEALRNHVSPDPLPPEAGGVDWDLRRLEWLVWWTDWALANCENPTFCNS